jgi:hypothetical protein
MKKLISVLFVLFVASTVWGDAHTTDSSGLFSAAATWTGDSLPIAGDSWTISAGNTVRYDITAATDWDAITISGTMTGGDAVADTNNYYLKASGNIVVSDGGSWTIGTSRSVPLLQTATFTIEMDGAYTIGDSTTGAIDWYCTEPTNKYVTLSGSEAIGQTELGISQNVSADIWAAGNTISICDIDGAQEHETRVIDAGAIAADHIHVTAGLTAAKLSGAYILLCNRNIKIIGGSGAAQILFSSVSDDTIDAWGYCATAAQGHAVSGGSGNTLGGYWGVGPTSGWETGWARVYSSSPRGTLVGAASGEVYVFYLTAYGSVSGICGGNVQVYQHSHSGYFSGIAIGQDYVFANSSGGIFLGTGIGNGSIYYYSNNGIMIGANITSGTYCWRRLGNCMARDSVIGTTAEEFEFTDVYVRPDQWIASYDHDGTTGAEKFVSLGGNTLSDTASPPTGFTTYYTHTCTTATYWNFRQQPMIVQAGQGIRVYGWIKQAGDDLSAAPPKIEIIDQFEDPLVSGSYSALASCNIPVSNGTVTTWQSVSTKYTNMTALAKPVWIRVSCKHASAVVSECWKVDVDRSY